MRRFRSTAQRCLQYPRLRYQQPQRSFVDVPSITGGVQTAMIGLQSMTGLPWWATFATSTVIVRTAMLPLVYRQILASRKLAAAVPELNFLFQLLRQRLKHIDPRNASEHIRIILIFFKGVGACIKLHDISPIQILSSPAASMAVFITFVYSLRQLISTENFLGLEHGGPMWFIDLTTKDPSFVLPLTAIGLSYSAIELAFTSTAGGAARLTLLIKDTLQTLLFLSIPLVLPLPAGVFFYWIPSSLWGMVQVVGLRRAGMGVKGVRGR